MAIFEKPPRYRTYLLTVWEERSQDNAIPGVWRFRLEDPRTDQLRGFVGMEEIIVFLLRELNSSGV